MRRMTSWQRVNYPNFNSLSTLTAFLTHLLGPNRKTVEIFAMAKFPTESAKKRIRSLAQPQPKLWRFKDGAMPAPSDFFSVQSEPAAAGTAARRWNLEKLVSPLVQHRLSQKWAACRLQVELSREKTRDFAQKMGVLGEKHAWKALVRLFISTEDEPASILSRIKLKVAK